LIIGDNASSDETESICREYAARDSRIRYYRHSENLGAAGNFLFVFNQARGSYFMWAAHDDLWESDWIEKMYAVVSNETGVMAYGRVRTINDTGMPMEHPANGRSFEFSQRNLWLRRFMYFLQYEGLGKANPIYGLYRRSDVTKRLAALTGRSLYADCLFLFDMLSGIRLRCVSETYHYKRVHSASVANTPPAKTSDRGDWHPGLIKIKGLMRSLLNTEAAVGYLQHAAGLERFIILTTLPVKILFTAYGLLLSHRSARRAVKSKATIGISGGWS
jgi:glycosyltransferase involved in cell wall biosynthesis